MNADEGYDIISEARSMVCLDLRFMTGAVFLLDCRIVDGTGRCSCDGSTIVFRRDTLIEEHGRDPNIISHEIAHCAMHCILGHTGNGNSPDTDLAEDMVVSYILDSFHTPHTVTEGYEDRMFAFERLAGSDGTDVASISCRISELSHYKHESYVRLFTVDDHSLRGDRYPDGWSEISKQVAVEIEGFSDGLPSENPLLMRLLNLRNRRTQDYRSFLRRFMSVTSSVRENPDEFDYIYYSYGLRTYGNIPLIDSTEYCDSPHVRVFAVAIDTSGSTMNGPVKRFVEEAFSALRQTSPGTDCELHIIQCDDTVRSDVTVTCEADMLELMKSFKLEGGGRTDFRPVFDHIAREQAEGRLRDLKGLLYFTDGKGTFPTARPPYETAFVLNDPSFDGSPVPPWAIRITLDPENM